MKRFQFCIVLLLFITHIQGQDIDWQHFKALQSSGKVPDDFTKLSSQKYETDRRQIDENARKGVQKTQDQFFLKSNFIIDEVLHSGRVIFGGPVTQYLNNIKDALLKDKPQLRDKIRIYTFRSSSVNAFTTNDGIVLVTTGLISQIENEAQLAFILSHEFQHYIQKHALSEYVEDREMAKGRGIYRNLDPNEIELKAFSYSKELEEEADSLGLLLFKKSDFSADAAKRVFDVLLYSYLPFDEVEFNKDYFNEAGYKIPNDYFLDTVSAISAVDDYDDSKSTHPNIKSRRSAMIREVADLKDDGRKLFVQPEDLFKKIQKICRYEDCLLRLNNCDFEEAFYNAYLLQQDDPNNIFLRKIMTRALYGASLYKNYNHATDHEMYYKDVEGESQQVYYLFDKMPKKDFNVLALRYAWNTHLMDSTNETLNKICKELAGELVNEFDLSLDDFKDAYAVAVPDTALKPGKESNKSSSGKNISKVDKIKTSETNKSGDLAYWRYAFVDYRKDGSFNRLLGDASKMKKEKIPEESPRMKKKNEYALGIDNAVIVNPLYLKVDETKKDPIRYVAAEQMKLDLQNKIQSCADALNLKINYLESMSLTDKDADKFNDLALLNNWISEELDHDDVPVINSNNEMMEQLVSKYKTDHFVWLGVIAFKEKEQYVAIKLIYSAILVVPFPFMLADVLTPDYETVFFTLVADGRTGEFEMQFSNDAKARDITSIQKSNLYYILQQMKSSPEKK